MLNVNFMGIDELRLAVQELRPYVAECHEQKTELDWLLEEMQKATLKLGRDDGENWEVNSFVSAVDHVCKRVAELESLVDGLKPETEEE